MFKKRIKKSRATWLGLLLKRGNSRSKLRKRQSERGIAIPIVIGMGLLMLLLSITIIVRSQSSQINSLNLNQAAQAGEVAETGVTRIQALFASNRTLPLITLYDVGTSNSWVEAGKSGPLSCNPSNITPLASFGNQTWIDIEAGKRQYRVFSYKYSPSQLSSQLTFTSMQIASPTDVTTKTLLEVSPSTYIGSGVTVDGQIAGVVGKLTKDTSGTYTFKPSGAPTIVASGGTFYPTNPNGTGRLQVEGRIINGTVTSGVTTSPVSQSQVIATSGIQVEVPVTPGDINNIPIPGTWLGATFAPSGNQTFASNVLVPCAEVTTDIPLETNTPPCTSTSPCAANITALKIPTVPTPPSTAYTIVGTIPSGNMTLPYTSATSGYNPLTGGYDYIVSKISSQNDTLTINPNYKVTIYLTGDIDMGGSGDIVHSQSSDFNSSSSPTSPVTIGVSPEKVLTTSDSPWTLTTPLSTDTYLQPDASVYGFLGSNKIPGKLSKAAFVTKVGSVTTTTYAYTFTPMTIPTGTSITVQTSDTFTPSTAPYKEVDFKIYGDGTTSTSSPPTICLSGNASLAAFILAPKYSFGMKGGGSANSAAATTTGISGSIWVGSYPAGCASSSNKVVVTQAGTWEDIGLSPENLPPSIGAAQTWNKKVAN